MNNINYLTDLKLDIEIINNEKKEIAVKNKSVLFSILGGLWMFFLISQPTKNNSIYDRLEIWKGIPAIFFFVLLIASGYVLMYVFFMIPSKGRLKLTSDGLTILQGKEKTYLRPNEIKSVKFYMYKTDIEETEVYVDLSSDKLSFLNEINVPFKNERETIMKIVENWKQNGIDAEILTTPPNNKQA